MLIGGLDVGTTGCKLTVYDNSGNFIHNEYREYNVLRKNGEHEIDANEIFDAVCAIIRNTCNKHRDLAAIGITTFGETFVALDADDNILLPSMLYTDPRGGVEKNELCGILGEEKITHISGVKPHQMYSLPKIMWIKKSRPEIYRRIKRILLMEDFIVYMLTGHAYIDYSLAARTLGFDIRNKCWSTEILKSAEIDAALLSKPVPPGTLAGCVKKEIAEKLGISPKLQIVNGCHDQVAAAVGAGVFEQGMAVDGTGTVECITPVIDKIPTNQKLYDAGYSVVPYVFENTYVCYALSFTGGATLKWYRDNFAKYESAIAEENGGNVYAQLDAKVPKSPTDILIMPHFAGAATPYMDNGSKALIAGLTLEHTNYDLYKALMEGVTYEIMTNIEYMESFGIKFEKFIAVGGGAASDVWLQMKADILACSVTALTAKEAGACGTCMLTAAAIGAVKDLNDARRIFVKEKQEFLPDIENTKKYRKNYKAYKKLYTAVRPILREVDGNYDE